MGTIPDLDVLTGFFVSAPTQLGWHRGFSHSAVFAIIAAPLLGWLIHRFHKQDKVTRRDWSWLVFWAILTHPILDIFTVYGTQFLQPFSNYPVAFNSIFIIDPLYTVPLFLGVLAASFYKADSPRRLIINRIGLVISTAYIISGIGVKYHVNNIVTDSLDKQQKEYHRYMTAPMPLNTLLWMSIAEDEKGYWIGLYSLLDANQNIKFRYIEKRDDLLNGYQGPALERLHWFSRGYYIVRRENNCLYYRDIRFGRLDGWLEEDGPYIFNFRLIPASDDPQKIVNFVQERSAEGFPEDTSALLTKLLHRVGGDRSVEYKPNASRDSK